MKASDEIRSDEKPLFDTGDGSWKCPLCSRVHPPNMMVVDTYPPMQCFRCGCGYHFDKQELLPSPSGVFV